VHGNFLFIHLINHNTCTYMHWSTRYQLLPEEVMCLLAGCNFNAAGQLQLLQLPRTPTYPHCFNAWLGTLSALACLLLVGTPRLQTTILQSHGWRCSKGFVSGHECAASSM
jgi:hypothetical protein